MGLRRWVLLGLPLLVLTVVGSRLLAQEKGKEEELWPKERIEKALVALDAAKAAGIISDERYQERKKMLQERLAGTFKGTALADTNPAEVNFVQNGGFEQINKNSAKDRSRWLWWGGWSWGGDYENFWTNDPQYVHSGQWAAGTRCTGAKGRIGTSTPPIPVIPGVAEYVFTLWAKGEGDNQIFINFEGGANGTLRQKVGPEWTELEVTGKPQAGAKEFTVYIYVTGQGTIWYDDAKLVPVGGDFE